MTAFKVCCFLPRLPVSGGGVLVGGSSVSAVTIGKHLGCGSDIAIEFLCGVEPTALKGVEKLSALLPTIRFCPIVVNAAPCSVQYGVELLVRVLKFCSRNGQTYDLVHGHSGFGVHALGTRLIGRMSSSPTVQSIYCPVMFEGHRRQWLFGPTASRVSLAGVDQVIATSENVSLSLQKSGVSTAKLKVIPPPTEVGRFERANGTEVRKALGISEHTKVILFVGSLRPNKGLRCLLEAMPEIQKQQPGTQLIATLEFEHSGFDEAHKRMTELIDRLHIGDSVIELGFVSDMPQLMDAANVLVVPFLDTFGPSDYPLVVIEAMAAGCPVVASNVGGVPEVVIHEQTGMLVESGDTQSIAETVVRVLTDEKLRTRLRHQAKGFVRAEFQASEVAVRIRRIYKNLVR